MHPACYRLFSVFDWCRLTDSPLRCSPLRRGMGNMMGSWWGVGKLASSVLGTCETALGIQGCFIVEKGQRWAPGLAGSLAVQPTPSGEARLTEARTHACQPQRHLCVLYLDHLGIIPWNPHNHL